ncbi:uncharacterized protein P174DRAFT_449770 [Aspergillus novofumigatus IBT 16806]|uniref:Uncharacterized protein n=1 Tax=Aspergillus novofumigatus (strain IBT 16806) TaxID=1392255 RepID=A0A2I1CCG7_ASPN1|nr:uncharacterized protein P174DRAFT_449770 [Aspergillus novofumigatus IBT 16806]PKX95322.1 hypothetical protein P174DRAFT_449770 [Aspergillus novofumigatus IBT 16806]
MLSIGTHDVHQRWINRSVVEWALNSTINRAEADLLWGGVGAKGDQAFNPPSRQVAQGETRRWPTLVLEVGVSESMAKLRSNAKFWLDNSKWPNQVRHSRRRSKARATFEKWMLMPPNAPNPAPPHTSPHFAHDPSTHLL